MPEETLSKFYWHLSYIRGGRGREKMRWGWGLGRKYHCHHCKRVGKKKSAKSVG